MPAGTRAAGTSAAVTFHDHLKELRLRLFAIVVVFIVAAGVAYNYKEVLLDVLMRPLGGEKLIYLTPAGGFSFIFQVTLYVGVIAAIPVLIYNIFRFIAPVLPMGVRTTSLLVIVASTVLLISGVLFGYFFAIAAAMQFLVHFADGFVTASLTAESYLSFVVAYTAGLGALFQLPLIILFIHWIHPLKPSGLIKFERYLILFAFVAAAIISPTPDVLNQTILAAPIIVMYQVGVIAVWISVRRRKRHILNPQRFAQAPVDILRGDPAPVQTVAAVQPQSRVVLPHEAKPVVVAVPRPRSIDGFSRPNPPRLAAPAMTRAGGRVAPVPPTRSAPHRIVRSIQPGQVIDDVILLNKVDDGAR